MKNRKLRVVLGYLIGFLPFNKVRCFFYRIIFGYQIHRAYIGWRVIIVVDHAKLFDCRIEARSRFIGPVNITIQKGASIGKGNTFICGWWVKDVQFNEVDYKRELKIEENTRISSSHYFDIVGSVILGKDSWIAGKDSQFWTHGAGVTNRNIIIGERCYIGSAVRFAPGSSIGNNTIVGLGSVVTKNFKNENVVIAGHPAKILRENYDWKTKKTL